ncbi:hypothetical protein Tco_0348968 [Tanacetum coccineum]
MTPPSWKQHLKEISLKKLCDIHDRAYMRLTILDSMLNNRTRKLISTLMKARASCDAIRKRESEKDKAYVELKRKCNDALHDLDKNPLMLDMRAEIKTLQGKVDGLHGEYSRLILEEKKRMGLLVAWLAKVALFYGKCVAFEEVAALKEPFELEKMYGYRHLSKKEFDQAGDNLATASYPFLAEVIADPYSPLEKLLSKRPKSLRAKPIFSKSKPSSLKAHDQIG